MADLVEILEQGVLAGRASASAAEVDAMTEVAEGECAFALDILLNGGEIFLRGREVAGLKIAAQLVEGLGYGIGGGGRRRCRGRRGCA